MDALKLLFSLDFGIFIAAGLVGMIAHWLKRFLRGQSSACFLRYFVIEHPRYTVYSLVTYFGAIAVTVAAGIDYHTLQALATSFLAGYAIDSTINKSMSEEDTVDVELQR